MTTKNNTPAQQNILAFKLIAISLPIILLLIIEVLLRVFSVGNNMNLIINHPFKEYSSYRMINPNIGKKYFSKFEATGTTNDIFLKQKPENGFRIFIMGSSTMVGFPYGQNLMASRILEQQLQDAYPSRNIEVINTAITAINSITLKDYIHEITDYSPDAIIFYAGHNEFYGAFGIGSKESISQNKLVQNLHFKMMHLRIYQALRKGMSKTMVLIAKSRNTAEERGSLMKRIVGDKDIAYQSSTYEYGINQYRENLSSIIKIANKKEIPIFVGNLVSNIKDLPPLISSTNPNHPANVFFIKGQQALQNNHIDSASRYFNLAKDYDPIRFRASEEINDVIDSLTQAYSTYRINVKKSFIDASDCGIVGNDLMTEHVHPTIKGQFVFSNTVFNALVASKLIEKDVSPYYNKSISDYQRTWPYTQLDSLIGDKYVKQLKSYWPFQSFDNTTTYRDTYKAIGHIDSLAYSILLKSNVSKAELHEQMATKYYKNKQYNLALKEYECLVKFNPYRSYYSNKAADCYLKENDYWNAEQALRNSIKYTPTYFAHLYLGELLILQNNLNDAITNYELALKLTNEDKQKALVLKKLADSYLTTNQTELLTKTKAKLKKVKVKYTPTIIISDYSYYQTIPNNIASYHNQANKLFEEQNYLKAIDELLEALKINESPSTYRYIGDIYLQIKNNELLFYYSKAYSTFKYDPNFLYNYIVALHVNKEKNKAIEELNQLKSFTPNYSGIANLERMLSSK